MERSTFTETVRNCKECTLCVKYKCVHPNFSKNSNDVKTHVVLRTIPKYCPLRLDPFLIKLHENG